MIDPRTAAAEYVAGFAESQRLVTADADLFKTFGIDGDDAFEFIDKFARKFEIDVSGYLWYFHHGEEGFGLGQFFFKPPYRRVPRLPITLNVLADAIETHIWPIQYPAHTPPRRRWDITADVTIMVVFVLLALTLLILLPRPSG